MSEDPQIEIVGRDDDLRVLRAHTTTSVTLIGPPGVGKTTLALAFARDVRHVFCDVANARTADELFASLHHSLEVAYRDTHAQADAIERLIDVVASSGLTRVVVDNAEQLNEEAAALLGRIVAASAGAMWVVTSRRPLGFNEEHLFDVRPFPVASDAQISRDSSAIQIFLRRAARRGATISDADLPAVAELVSIVEGVPLAIEMAASWLPLLTASEVAASLRNADGEALSELGDDGKRTLDTVLQRSWNLLDETAREVLLAASVTRSSFDLDALVAWCGESGANASTASELEPVDQAGVHAALIGTQEAAPPGLTRRDIGAAVQRLLDASLIRVVPARGRRRWALYQIVATFARRRARDGDRRATFERRMATYYATQAARWVHGITSGDAQASLRAIQDEVENLAQVASLPDAPVEERGQVALAFAVGGRASENLRGAITLTEAVTGDLDALVHANPDLALRLLREQWELYRAVGSPRRAPTYARLTQLAGDLEVGVRTACLVHLTSGVELTLSGDLDGGLQTLASAAERAGAAGLDYEEGLARAIAAFWERERGDPATAIFAMRRAIEQLDAAGAQLDAPVHQINLATLYLQVGAVDAAEALLRRSIATLNNLNYRAPVAACLQRLALTLVRIERFEEADALLDQAEVMAKRSGSRGVSAQIATARSQLSAARGRVHEVREWIVRVIDQHRSDGNARMLAYGLARYGAALHLEGNLDEAIDAYTEALQRGAESGPSLRATLLGARGAVHADRGAVGDATRDLHDARALFEDGSDPMVEMTLKLNAAHVAAWRWRNDNDNDARSSLTETLFAVLRPAPPPYALPGFDRPRYQWSMAIRWALRMLRTAVDADTWRETFADAVDPGRVGIVEAPDGEFIRAPGGAWLDLSRQVTLWRVLEPLLRAAPSAVDASTLIEAGWPGERMIAEAATNRLHQVVSRLRRAGLGDTIERTETGYRLRDGVAVFPIPERI